jgi:hypothetical protein
MNKLLFLLLFLPILAHSGYFKFQNKEQVIYSGGIPDTSIEYYYNDEDLFTQDFINTTKMTRSGMGKPKIWLFGWSIRGIPAAFEYWNIQDPGEYLITLEVVVEHNRNSYPWCNVSSDCYLPDSESWTETFTDAMKIIVIAPVLPVIAEPLPVIINSEPVLTPSIDDTAIIEAAPPHDLPEPVKPVESTTDKQNND